MVRAVAPLRPGQHDPIAAADVALATAPGTSTGAS